MRLCPSNREIQRLLQRVEEECRQVAQQQDLDPPPSPPHDRHREPIRTPAALEPRLADVEPVQDLFEEDEDYLEPDTEGLPLGGGTGPGTRRSPSALPVIQNVPPSPGHRDPPYLSGGPSVGQAFELHPSPPSVSPSSRQGYQSTSPSSLSPTHQSAHFRPSPPHTSPAHQAPPQPGSYHFSPPPSPLRRGPQYRASPTSSEGAGLYRPQSASAATARYQQEAPPLQPPQHHPHPYPHHHPHAGRPKSPLSKMAGQRSFQLPQQVPGPVQVQVSASQGQWLQPAKAQIVRTNQPSAAVHSSAVLAGNAYGQMAHSVSTRGPDADDLLEGGYGYGGGGGPLHVQGGLSAAYRRAVSVDPGPPEEEPLPRPCSAYPRPVTGGLRYGHAPQISRSQSAAYYPAGHQDPERQQAQLGSPENPHALRRPVSAAEPKPHPPTPRPLIHSQSVGLRFSPSSGSLGGGSAVNLGPGFRPSASAQQMEIPLKLSYEGGFCDEPSPASPPQGPLDMRVLGGTYPGEALRSRATPFMGVTDKTARAQQQYLGPQPPPSSSSLSSRSWAVSSLDVVTSPATSPSGAGYSHIAYYNRTNNAHNGHLLEDDCYGPPGSGSGSDATGRVSQAPTYPDVKLARTLPVAQAYQDAGEYRHTGRSDRAGPTSPIKPKRPFVESNV